VTAPSPAGALRVSHIWREEVMADRILPLPGTPRACAWEQPFAIGCVVVSVLAIAMACAGLVFMRHTPTTFLIVLAALGAAALAASLCYAARVARGDADTSDVTIGASPTATFTTPSFGLPPNFAILRFGAHGHELTLRRDMGGTVKLDGVELSVADAIARASAARDGPDTPWWVSPIRPGDWGIIELDRDAEHTLFFHYVPPATPLPRVRRWHDELLAPAIVFALVLHAVFLAIAFTIARPGQHSFVFPGADDIFNEYDIERPIALAAMNLDDAKAGTKDGEPDTPPASTAGASGHAGGEGDRPRRRAPDPDEGADDAAIIQKVRHTGLLRHAKSLTKIAMRGGFDDRLGAAMARIEGPAHDGSLRGAGGGKGTGVGLGAGSGTTRGGTGKGPGGGGTAHGDVVTQAAIKTGGTRPARGVAGGRGLKETAVHVRTGTATGALGSLTAAQINKVVQSRKNAIRACYERQLQRTPTLGGKIVVRWTIVAGKVTRAKIKKTTMRNGAVEDCIVRQILRLRFPSPSGGAKAVVNYPFIFSSR